MKLHLRVWALGLVCLPHTVAAGRVRSSRHKALFQAIAPAPQGPDALKSIASCTSTAKKFLKKPVQRGLAVQQAVDFCAVDTDISENNYLCPHFKEGIERALERDSLEQMYDAQSFCESTESYMLGMRGASRVPRTGSGPLLDFNVSKQCPDTVALAFAPDETLPSKSVPDFWYAMCMNQDCAHFLPSRTRWCNIKKQPTHSVVVCEAIRKFAIDEVAVHAEETMTPKQICQLFGEFVEEMGIDVDAYEHVIHADSAKRVPVPSDTERALVSSQLVNEAKANYIREHSGEPLGQAEQQEKQKQGATSPAPVERPVPVHGGSLCLRLSSLVLAAVALSFA